MRASITVTSRGEPFTIAGNMRVLLTSIAVAVALTTLVRAQEESASPAEKAKTYPEVPKQYEVGEDTISPDGRFAILYPVRDEDSNEGPSFPNVLVRLKPYEVIKGLTKSSRSSTSIRRGKKCVAHQRQNGVEISLLRSGVR